MYNLIVSGSDESWNGDPFILETARCVREYTDQDITEKYSKFTQSNINEITRFPCIFAYEDRCRKNPKFGLIKEIAKRQKKVKIVYEIIDLEIFLTYSDISDIQFELDISDWEMNRTHWAIKNVNLVKELIVKGIKLPQWAKIDSKAVDITKHQFEVALSFPGEIRSYIEPIIAELEREVGPNSYFYDNNYKAQLARPSLDILLQDIYRKRSKLIVIFLCKKYQEKEWCGVELRAIKEIIMSRQHEKVMFIKVDDGNVEGVFKTDGYIDGHSYSPKELARFIKERIDLLS
ncbi:MAG: hypothetical protein WC650_02020 [Candidatus Doudnabacteria bacterium]